MPSSSDRPRSGVGEGQEREFGRRIKSRMVQLVPYRNARPPARRSPLMQALHARRGSITSEHSRGFLREFGRRAIAKALGERAALDDAKGAGRLTRGSRKLQVGRGGYEPPPPSPRPLAPPALDCVGGEREREPTAPATAAVATAAAPAMSVGLIMHTRLLCDGLRASTTNARKRR